MMNKLGENDEKEGEETRRGRSKMKTNERKWTGKKSKRKKHELDKEKEERFKSKMGKYMMI